MQYSLSIADILTRAGISLEVLYHRGFLLGVELVYLDKEAFTVCECPPLVHVIYISSSGFLSLAPRSTCGALYLPGFPWGKCLIG